jgi:hypothetical protein
MAVGLTNRGHTCEGSFHTIRKGVAGEILTATDFWLEVTFLKSSPATPDMSPISLVNSLSLLFVAILFRLLLSDAILHVSVWVVFTIYFAAIASISTFH